MYTLHPFYCFLHSIFIKHKIGSELGRIYLGNRKVDPGYDLSGTDGRIYTHLPPIIAPALHRLHFFLRLRRSPLTFVSIDIPLSWFAFILLSTPPYLAPPQSYRPLQWRPPPPAACCPASYSRCNPIRTFPESAVAWSKTTFLNGRSC